MYTLCVNLLFIFHNLKLMQYVPLLYQILIHYLSQFCKKTAHGMCIKTYITVLPFVVDDNDDDEDVNRKVCFRISLRNSSRFSSPFSMMTKIIIIHL